MSPEGFDALDVHGALRAAQAAANALGRGRTALHAAAEFGHVDATRLLLAHGMSPLDRDAEGETALHAAVRNGRVEVARLLLAAGADPAAPDTHGVTPRDLAASPDMTLALRGATTTGRRRWRWLWGWWRR